MRFKNKVAIVTGGSSGIGKETARRLVAEGASVVLTGKEEAKLNCASKEIGGSSGQVRVLAGDIAKPATGAALVEAAVRNFGGLDILVSNAGVFRPKPFDRRRLRLVSRHHSQREVLYCAGCCESNEEARWWHDCAYRVHVGPASDRRDTVQRLLSGQCGGPLACSQSCVGVGGR